MPYHGILYALLDGVSQALLDELPDEIFNAIGERSLKELLDTYLTGWNPSYDVSFIPKWVGGI